MNNINEYDFVPAAQYFVAGIPAPQGSKTAIRRGTKIVLLEGKSTTGRKKHRAWRAAVKVETSNFVDRTGVILHQDPLMIRYHFLLPRPPSVPIEKRLEHSVKPDLDKLLRSTNDGLADGGILTHDQKITGMYATKEYAESLSDAGVALTFFTNKKNIHHYSYLAKKHINEAACQNYSRNQK